MANPQKGEVLVQVEAGEFTLVFTVGALAAIEGQFDGRTFQNVLAELGGDDTSASTLVIVVWAALKRHHPMSIEAAGDLLTLAEMPLWGAKVADALRLAQPVAAKGKAARPRKAAAS